MATIAARAAGARHSSLTRVQPRIQSVDVLRGIVMVIMALDHIRDFFHYGSQLFSPEDLTKTNALLFFTRWVTHFCAPVFVFLAGTGAYLATRRGMSRASVSRFVLVRGLWLVLVEMTLVLFGGTFNLSYRFVIWQVIWAIGWSMVALSVLVYLPWRVLLVFSVALIAAHNAFDGLSSSQLGSFGWIWKILHEGFAPVHLPGGVTALVIYPLIPWIGVMSAGYCFGRIFDLDPQRRRTLMLQIGLALTVAFITLRWLNGYGDPSRWSAQPTPLMTVLSFLRTSKYPPSLLYLLMTLGPSLMALSALDRMTRQRSPSAAGLRARAALLLRRPLVRVAPGGDRICVDALRPRRLHVRAAACVVAGTARLPARLWVRPVGGLRCLGRHRRGALSRVPVVCGRESAEAIASAQLFLTRCFCRTSGRRLDRSEKGSGVPTVLATLRKGGRHVGG